MVAQHVDGATQTYGQLHHESLRWARAYAGQGVRPGDTVVTMLPNSFDAFAAWLGCSWIGAIEVPINTFWKGQWLIHGINVVEARLLVVARRFLDQVMDVATSLASVQTLVVLDDGPESSYQDLPFRAIGQPEFHQAAPATTPLREPRLRDPMGVLFTSGTTGRSKASLTPWGFLQSNFCYGNWDQFDDFVHHACFAPYHGTGKLPLLGAINHPSGHGRIVIRDGWSTEFFWDDVNTFAINGALLPAACANFLLQAEELEEDSFNPLEGVVMAPVIPQVDDFKRRFQVRVCTIYGMSEIAWPFASSGWDVTSENSKSCGKIRPGYQVRLVDEDDMEVPLGDPGELIVRHDQPWSMSLGYLGMPEATASAWQNGWFHTGDGFRQDGDGNFFFVDRIKDAIRRRGENISSFEVEEIVNSFPAVSESAAVAVPSDVGEDDLKVFLVPKPGYKVNFPDLIQFLAPRMPSYAVPRYLELIDTIPKTPTMRVQKHLLRSIGNNSNTWDRELDGTGIETSPDPSSPRMRGPDRM